MGESERVCEGVIECNAMIIQDMRTLRFGFAHNQEAHGRRNMYERLQVNTAGSQHFTSLS